MLSNQKDPEATKAAGFSSPKSYVSFAGHVYLYGVIDHGNMRMRIYERAKGMCELCDVPHFVPWEIGEWHHTQKTLGGRRCDCLKCGAWSCREAHVRTHGRTTRWGEGPAQREVGGGLN